MQILMLDMDSVLLTPMGYYRALQETVRLVAAALGYTGRHLTRDEIEGFEAAGVTSEWESSAICACLFLRQAWRAGIDIDLPDVPPLPDVPRHSSSRLPIVTPTCAPWSEPRPCSSIPKSIKSAVRAIGTCFAMPGELTGR
jgi:hypothetical protein